jgi:hypothetical protein
MTNIEYLFLEIKIPSALGRDGTPAVPPKLAFRPAHCRLASASPLTLGCGSNYWRGPFFTGTAREGTSVGFCRMQVSICARISLSASADVLSSVIACWPVLSPEFLACQGQNRYAHFVTILWISFSFECLYVRVRAAESV